MYTIILVYHYYTIILVLIFTLLVSVNANAMPYLLSLYNIY